MSLLNPSCISTNAMRHGRSFESVAIDKFSEQFRIIVEPSGLCIDIEKTYLAASPDGFIRKDSIVEVKCPYSGRYMHIHPKCKPFRFLELRDRNIALKKTSNYYYQIQGQLHITKRKQCYFLVYTFKQLHVEIIEYDKNFCEIVVLPKLELFYKKYFRKFVAKSL